MHPVIEYSTSDGKTLRLTGQAGSYPPAYNVGDRVDLLYTPLMPEKTIVSEFGEVWGMTTLSGGLALALFVMALSFFFLKMRPTSR